MFCKCNHRLTLTRVQHAKTFAAKIIMTAGRNKYCGNISVIHQLRWEYCVHRDRIAYATCSIVFLYCAFIVLLRSYSIHALFRH